MNGLDRKYIEHFVDIDEMMELKIKIPERLDALELKALMSKADKLFKLSEVQIISEQREPKTYKRNKDGYFRWNEELITKLVEMKDKGFKVPQISQHLCSIANDDYFTTKRCWGKLGYIQTHNLWKKYRGQKVPQEIKVSSVPDVKTTNVATKPKKLFPKGQFVKKFTEQMKDSIKHHYAQGKKSKELTELLNEEFNQNFTAKQVADKINYMKRQGVIPK